MTDWLPLAEIDGPFPLRSRVGTAQLDDAPFAVTCRRPRPNPNPRHNPFNL